MHHSFGEMPAVAASEVCHTPRWQGITSDDITGDKFTRESKKKNTDNITTQSYGFSKSIMKKSNTIYRCVTRM
jgi:hypothetical protein